MRDLGLRLSLKSSAYGTWLSSNELSQVDKNECRKLQASLVVQHNHLIEANYSLRIQEARIILWLISQVGPDDVDFKEHTIKISAFCQLAGLKSKNMHKEIKDIAYNLLNNVLHIQYSNENWLKVAWLSSAEYVDGTIKLCFSPKLKPYLLELKNCFTRFHLSDLMKFKSIYALRLYEILKQYQSIGTRELRVKDMRNMFCIKEDEYSRYSHLKLKVINRAQKEINEKSDIAFNFEEIKEGKKVISLRFYIFAKHQKENGQGVLFEGALELGVSKSALEKLLTQYSQEELLQGLSVLRECSVPIKNPLQFLKKALKEYWQPFEKVISTGEPVLNIMGEIEALSEPESCQAIRKAFIERQGEKEYKSWLATAEVILEGSVLRIGVKSAFAAQYIQTHYVHLLKEMDQTIEYVEVVVKSEQEVMPVTEERRKISNQKSHQAIPPRKTASVKRTIVHPEKGRKKPNKELEENQKKELPPLKQLSLWGRVKTFLSSNN